MNTLLSVFYGPSGKASSTRLATLWCVGIILGTWCWVSVVKCELQPLSPEQMGLVLGVCGVNAWRGSRDKQTKEQS